VLESLVALKTDVKGEAADPKGRAEYLSQFRLD